MLFSTLEEFGSSAFSFIWSFPNLKYFIKNFDKSKISNNGYSLSLLWECCQIPDFVKKTYGNHLEVISKVFGFLNKKEGKISNNFMIDREKLDLLSERSRHWHSLLGAVRLFGDTDLEVELEVLNNEAQNINSIYIEMEQRMQDHYAHTLQFIHNLYTRDHANKEF